MILSTNFYLKMPASTYDGRRFLVVVEPMLSPRTINARIYGPDFVGGVAGKWSDSHGGRAAYLPALP